MRPLGPGVYRMTRRRRRSALCRQGQKRAQAHRQLYAARRPYQPHRADDRVDRLDGLRLDRDGDRGAAARDQLHQADEAALQRVDARRQVVPLYLHVSGDHPAPQIMQASRRADAEGRLFRPLRQRLGGQSHPECAGARLSAALLHRQLLREPHAAMPAASDQALRGALHRRDRSERLCGAGRARRARFSPAKAARCATCSRRR